MASPKTCIDCGARLPDLATREVCEACVTVAATAAPRRCVDCGAALPPGRARETCEACVTLQNTILTPETEALKARQDQQPAPKPARSGIPKLADYEILGEVARG